ncbi:hypothetical protein [Desulfosporosinus acidiphilus]|nr:hypothetical protein [Desulfosporosinus acidiphilus]
MRNNNEPQGLLLQQRKGYWFIAGITRQQVLVQQWHLFGISNIFG